MTTPTDNKLAEALRKIESALRVDSRQKDICGDDVEYHLDGPTMYYAINTAREALREHDERKVIASGTTHSEECWRWHHECAVGKIEREHEASKRESETTRMDRLMRESDEDTAAEIKRLRARLKYLEEKPCANN
jgi:hypothetical protein